MMQIVTLVVGFIIPRVILTTYGSEINGLVSSISQFLSYFSLVEAGLAGSAIFYLYKPLAENNYKEINGIVSAAKKQYTISGYIFISLTLGLAFVYPFYIVTSVISPFNVGLLVLILGINGALEFFTLAKYRVLLTADQKTYVISIATTVQIIASAILIFVLAKYKVDIVLLRLIVTSSIILRSVILMIYCKIKYKYLDYKETPNTQALDKRWDALYLQILGAITMGTPIILITLILKDLKLVSVYTIFNMVIAGIGGVLSIFISGLSASFGDVIIRGELKIFQKAYQEFEFAYYSMITIVYAITFVTIMPFINIYTKGINDVNYNMPIVGALFVLNGLLYNIKTPQGMLVISSGMFKETKVQTTMQGVITVVIGAILAPSMGITGILLGSILANIYRDIDLLFFIPHNLTKLPVKDTAFRLIRIFGSVFLICLPFHFIPIVPNNFSNWILFTVGVSLYAVTIVFVVGVIFEKNEVGNILRRVKSLGAKK